MTDEHRFFTIGADDISKQPGLHFFGSFDSGQNGNYWHRARIFGGLGGFSLSFYSSDYKNVIISGKELGLDESIGLIPADELASAPFWSEFYEDPDDILLHRFKGRYLWVMLKQNDNGLVFEKIRLYFPAHSFTRYLPEIYQSSGPLSFFARFVALFQSVYLDIDETIAEFANYLDPEKSNNEYLPILAEWLGCEEFELLPDSQDFGNKRAEFLLRCVEWYRGYGTVSCLKEVLEWLCGKKPFVVEYKDFEAYKLQKKITDLFFKDMFIFTVLIYKTELYSAAAGLIEKMKPAYTKCNLVMLEDKIILNGHSYLGFNSRI